jgi:ADP-ribosyl-[dinitrogen reductase] hydrolase
MLGLTFCPGMNTDDERTRRHGGTVHRRSLDADLSAIKNWGAMSVVTLLDDFEFRRLAVTTLGATVQALGMRWHHLPIRDEGTPDSAFEERWVVVRPDVRAALTEGGRVLIHCRHGHGRTGTLAARLLIEFGDDAETAIQKVRAVRPKCISIGAQEQHVRYFAIGWLRGPGAKGQPSAHGQTKACNVQH